MIVTLLDGVVVLVRDHDHGVTRLVDGGVPLLFLGHHHRAALRAHEDLVLGELEVRHADGVLVLTRGEQSGLVDEVLEVGAGEAGRAASGDGEVDVRRERNALRVDLRIASRPRTSGRLTVMRRSKRPGRRIAGSRTSGRLVAAMMMTPSFDSKPFHLDEELVQRLLALVVTAAEACAAVTTDGVESRR